MLIQGVATLIILIPGFIVADNSDIESLRGTLSKTFDQLNEAELLFGSGQAAKSFNEIKNLDNLVNEVADWDDCPNSAPLIITNSIVRNRGRGQKYFDMWDDDKTPDIEWNFLTNFRYIDGWWADSVEVDEISADQALNLLHDAFVASGKKKIMFFVHGWNSDLEDAWCGGKNFREGSDYFGIPVIWRTDRGMLYDYDYRYDRIHTAPNAGITLSHLYESFFAQIEDPKSWMCHSMGCHVTQFFAQEIHDDDAFREETRFDDVFLVAPDLRYDIFNEWPHGSGKDKNECAVGEWNNPDNSHRIPDCRLGGGDALVDMTRRKVQVHWNRSDPAASAKEARLSADVAHTWPISVVGLLGVGNDVSLGARAPLQKFDDTVTFTEHTEQTLNGIHSYQFFQEMFDVYDEYSEEIV